MNLTAASRIGDANSGNAAGDGATALRFKRVGQQQQQLPSQVNGQPRSLEKSGKEYARILYLLETALASHHVKVTHVQVWDVSQPTIVEQFEREVRRCPGVVPLDAWVDVDSLNANIELELRMQEPPPPPSGSRRQRSPQQTGGEATPLPRSMPQPPKMMT